MRIQPILLLSFLLAIPVHAALVGGSERAVTTTASDVAAFDQTRGHIAGDGDGFLAVWIDHTLQGNGDVHGARVTADGKRIGDDVLRIATTDLDENRVGIAFGGGRYLVAWPSLTALRARFIARDGTMSAAFDVAPLANFNAEPHVTFNGDRFLVTWPNIPMFNGALIDLNGTVLKTFGIQPTVQTTFEGTAVAVDGGFRFVTSITDFNGVPNGNGYPGDVGVTPIDANGTVGARVVIAPATTPVFDLRAAASGNEFVVAWSTAIGIPGGTVRAVRVTPNGAGAIEIIPTEGMYLHALGADASGFFVIYGADTTKFLRRLGSNTSSVVATPDTKNAVLDIASNGARSLALLRGNPRPGFEFGPAGADLYAVRLDTQDIEPLTIAPRHQQQPDVAAAGDLRLAVWCEYIGRDRRLGIVGSRLNASGDAIDPNGIDLNVSVNHPQGPRVASNGTDWLVVWVDGVNLYGVRIAHDGTRIDTQPQVLLIASQIFENSDLAVSWDGTQYVVIYFSGQFMRGLHTTVRAARVPAHGEITTAPLALSGDGANEFPSIGSGPSGSLVVWRNGNVLQGALLSPGGSSTPIAFPTTPMMTPRPSVAWNAGTFLVAAPFRGSFGDQLQWLLVSDTGVVRTPLTAFLPIVVQGLGYSSVEAEAYEDRFLVYWNGAGSSPILAARISADGIFTEGATVASTNLVGYPPNFGAAGNMVVYARRIGNPTRELARVFSRQVQFVNGNPRRRAVH
jgi:hypothetical protein